MPNSPCEICGEARQVDRCHIVPRDICGSDGDENILILCPTHHRCFDRGMLTPHEWAAIVWHNKSSDSQSFVIDVLRVRQELYWSSGEWCFVERLTEYWTWLQDRPEYSNQKRDKSKKKLSSTEFGGPEVLRQLKQVEVQDGYPFYHGAIARLKDIQPRDFGTAVLARDLLEIACNSANLRQSQYYHARAWRARGEAAEFICDNSTALYCYEQALEIDPKVGLKKRISSIASTVRDNSSADKSYQR